MNKSLLILSMLTLVFLDRASGIGITLNTANGESEATSYVVNGNSTVLDEEAITALLPYSITTAAQLSQTTANGTWNFTNSTNQAVFSGAMTLADYDHEFNNNYAGSAQYVHFSLSEQVSYSLTGSLLFTPTTEVGPSLTFGPQASIRSQLLGIVDFTPVAWPYNGVTEWSPSSSDLLELPVVGIDGTTTGGSSSRRLSILYRWLRDQWRGHG